MAYNSDFYGNSQRPPAQGDLPSYHAQDPYPYSTHTPYHGEYPSSAVGHGSTHTHGDGGSHGHYRQQNAPSPFRTPFDDPASTTTSLQQHGVYPDTAYYGQGGTSSDTHIRDNIPLQDQPGKPGDEMNDHIYDQSPGAAGQSKNTKKIRVGELGMLASGGKKIPWVCYLFSVIQIGVFIGELAKTGILNGSPVVNPKYNPMIGPSTQILINMGARYVPCMHNVKEIQGSDIEVKFLCPNSTSPTSTSYCPLSEVCGFGGVPNPTFNDPDQSPQPNQWFRFITPIFMHAGVIHIAFNLLLQLTLAKDMEMVIGSIRFFLVYISAGIFGFVMGGNFAAPGIASTGASGSLFGVIALVLLDLLYSWGERRNPVKDLMFILLDMVVSFVLGLLPGLDNFSHIGGFLMGLGLGICILHSPNSLRKKIGGSDNIPYAAVNRGSEEVNPGFLKSPVGFFKGRRPLWWAWWLVRAGFLIAVIIVFIVLLNNFYNGSQTCSWCKYLSCLPVNGWCDIGTIQKSTTN